MDLSPGLKIVLVPLIFCLEVISLLIKHSVLAIRLLANMMGGHVVLAVILAFIAAGAQSIAISLLVTPTSIAGAVALSMLELLVAFIQAYVFAFLTALFIGMAVHPH
jgi:F-type H+-transporting ATPase subunit a